MNISQPKLRSEKFDEEEEDVDDDDDDNNNNNTSIAFIVLGMSGVTYSWLWCYK